VKASPLRIIKGRVPFASGHLLSGFQLVHDAGVAVELQDRQRFAASEVNGNTMAAPAQQVHYPNENEGPRILGATLSITALALITMTARLYVRLRIIRNVGWDVRSPAVAQGVTY
jgi:hypothetical protein